MCGLHRPVNVIDTIGLVVVPGKVETLRNHFAKITLGAWLPYHNLE